MYLQLSPAMVLINSVDPFILEIHKISVLGNVTELFLDGFSLHFLCSLKPIFGHLLIAPEFAY